MTRRISLPVWATLLLCLAVALYMGARALSLGAPERREVSQNIPVVEGFYLSMTRDEALHALAQIAERENTPVARWKHFEDEKTLAAGLVDERVEMACVLYFTETGHLKSFLVNVALLDLPPAKDDATLAAHLDARFGIALQKLDKPIGGSYQKNIYGYNHVEESGAWKHFVWAATLARWELPDYEAPGGVRVRHFLCLDWIDGDKWNH